MVSLFLHLLTVDNNNNVMKINATTHRIFHVMCQSIKLIKDGSYIYHLDYQITALI